MRILLILAACLGLSGCVTATGITATGAAADAGAFVGGAVAGYVNERQAAKPTPGSAQ
jgi:hypothetical protein